MFNRLGRGFSHATVIRQALFSPPRRYLLRRMMRFANELPPKFNQPLPVMMSGFTPGPVPASPMSLAEIRRMADAVAALPFYSELGYCLRRSLLRYYFLREAGVPVNIVFGARLKDESEGGGIGGHAWLTLHNSPYHEEAIDYQGFVPVYVYPENSAQRHGH